MLLFKHNFINFHTDLCDGLGFKEININYISNLLTRSTLGKNCGVHGTYKKFY